MAEMIWTLENSGGDYTDAAQWITDTAVNLTSTDVKVYAGTLTGAIATGAAVTGDTSGATGTVIGVATSGQILVDDGGGTTFQSGEEIELDSDPTNQFFTTSDGGDETTSAVLECYRAGWETGYVVSTRLTMVSATTSSTQRRIMRAATGEEHDGADVTSGFWFKSTIGDDIVRIQEENSSIEFIGVQHTQSGGNNGASIRVLDANGFALGCICQLVGTAANMTGFGKGNGHFYSCMAIDYVIGYAQSGATSDFSDLFNFVAKDCTTGIDTTAGGDYDIRNCVVYGGTTRYTMGAGADLGSEFNAADDAASNTPPGANPITADLVSGDFVDVANDNFQPTSGNAADGTGDTQTFSIAATEGIDRASFTDWNLGAWAVSEAGAGPITIEVPQGGNPY